MLIAAWIREYRNSETVVKLDDIVTPGTRRTRSVPQGDPCAADLLGAALDTPAAKCCDMCQHKNGGLPVGSTYLGLLLFADSCWNIAMSQRELQTVARAWNELVKASGLQGDCGEAVWCSTAQDSLAASITVSDKLITRRAREEGFKALGVWITFDGHFTLAEREVAAWRRFCANRQLLCDNNVALKYRLRLLTSCVVSSMYWFARSWILTSTQSTHLCAVQDRMLRKMIYARRRPKESAESHMTRWARLLRNCRAKQKFIHGDDTYFASCFSWCGHIARIATRDSKREKGKLFLHRNMARLRCLKKELGTQCHGRRFRVWRWEQAVAQCLGDEWVNTAQNSTV